MTRRAVAAGTLAAVLIVGAAGVASASPKPPTNGGNGAGHSGQCTGPADERPKVCSGT